MARDAKRQALPAESFSESRAKAADASATPEMALSEVTAEDEALPPPDGEDQASSTSSRHSTPLVRQ